MNIRAGIETYHSARAETACGIICILKKVTTQSHLRVNFFLNHRTTYTSMNVSVSWAAVLFSNSNIPEANLTRAYTLQISWLGIFILYVRSIWKVMEHCFHISHEHFFPHWHKFKAH